MNDRLTIQDFTDLLATKHGMSKKDAEAFVKEFFLLIEQALEDDKYVKIKGLGTFKLIDVDSRESVNVNTGERFQIQEHSKVSFTPDGNLRDTINKPFSHFETIVLNEKTVLPDTPIEEMGEEESFDSSDDEKGLPVDIEESSKLHNVPDAETEKNKDEAIQENNVVHTNPQQDEILERDLPKEQDNVSAQEEITTQKSENVEESSPITANSLLHEPKEAEESDRKDSKKLSAEEIIALELQKQKDISSKNEMLKTSPVEKKNNLQQTNPKENKTHISYLVAIIFIVMLICGGTIIYIYNPDLFSTTSNTDSIQMPINEKKESVIPVLPDSTTNADSTLNEGQKVVNNNIETNGRNANKELIENNKNADDKKSENVKEQQTPLDETNLSKYVVVGTKTTHKIKAGETLTKVSLAFYGSKAFWPFIVKYNRDVIKDPDNVPFGTAIKIPELALKK